MLFEKRFTIELTQKLGIDQSAYDFQKSVLPGSRSSTDSASPYWIGSIDEYEQQTSNEAELVRVPEQLLNKLSGGIFDPVTLEFSEDSRAVFDVSEAEEEQLRLVAGKFIDELSSEEAKRAGIHSSDSGGDWEIAPLSNVFELQTKLVSSVAGVLGVQEKGYFPE